MACKRHPGAPDGVVCVTCHGMVCADAVRLESELAASQERERGMREALERMEHELSDIVVGDMLVDQLLGIARAALGDERGGNGG